MKRGSRRPLRRTAAVLALAAVTACGSTVQQQSTLTGPGASELDGGVSDAPGGDGLAIPGADGALGNDDPSGEAAVPGGGAFGEQGDGSGGAAEGGRRQEGGSAPAAQAPGTAPEAGATADRSPLRLGLLYVNNDAAAGAGVDNGNSFGPRRSLEAQVAAANARGGLAGRRVQPTYVELQSSSSSYASDLQAACESFVEDAKVSVVLSFSGINDDQFSSCLSKAGVAHVNGSYALGDTTSLAASRTTVSLAGLSVDRRSKATLEQLTRSGYLTRSSRIGVVVEGCPYNQRAFERTLLPTAARLGLDVVETATTRCFGGINDLGGLASDSQNAVLRFSSQKVDRVLVVSSVEANVLLVFTNAAESQGYRPGYGLTSLALANVLKDNIPHAQLVNAKGVGWIPSVDDSGPSLTPTAQTRTCAESSRAYGVSPASPADHFTVFSHCDAFGLTDRVLHLSRGATAPRAWSAALDGVGTSFRGAAVLEGRTDFSDGRRDGPALGRIFAWDRGCSCFRYTGGSFPI